VDGGLVSAKLGVVSAKMTQLTSFDRGKRICAIGSRLAAAGGQRAVALLGPAARLTGVAPVRKRKRVGRQHLLTQLVSMQ
jgi:hypothetical protein